MNDSLINNALAQISGLSTPLKLAVLVGLAIATHMVVILIRQLGSRLMSGHMGRRYQKLQTVGTLLMSAVIFSLYFLAFGLILREFGVSLTTYLASASVLGLAIGFGSQGIVQDVVTGLTLIFSDLVDVGDLVEISGQSGIVRAITMRFVELENALGAEVFIPNRTINNITNYPRGYVRCIVDVTLRGDEATKLKSETVVMELMAAAQEQFAGIIIAEPSSVGRIKFQNDKEILRLKFRIWPNRGQPIETTFAQELISHLKKDDPTFESWMVAIFYEVEERNRRSQQGWPWRRTAKK